jgi:hypothetical protein
MQISDLCATQKFTSGEENLILQVVQSQRIGSVTNPQVRQA